MNGQSIVYYIAESLIGQWNVAVGEGYEDYKASYVDMAKAIYIVAVNEKSGVGRNILSEAERFNGKQYLRNLVFLAMSRNIMQWGVPSCHDGSDTMSDVSEWVFE